MDTTRIKTYFEEQASSPTSGQPEAATVPKNTLHEDGEQPSSLSHSPSPKFPPILIHPSDSGASRPRSSEGRINLPKDTHSRGLRTASMSFKKRSIGAQIEKALDIELSAKTDPFLNFGIGDDFQCASLSKNQILT